MILHEAKDDHENSAEFLPMLALTPLSSGESFSDVNDNAALMPFLAFGDSDDDEDDMEEDDFDDMEEDDFDDDEDDFDDDEDDDEDDDDDFDDDDDDFDDDEDFDEDEE
jgi:hypothetical protein